MSTKKLFENPITTNGHASTFVVRLHMSRIKKFIATNKHRYCMVYDQKLKYMYLLTEYFHLHPGVKKLIDKSVFGHGGNYSSLINRLISHGA